MDEINAISLFVFVLAWFLIFDEFICIWLVSFASELKRGLAQFVKKQPTTMAFPPHGGEAFFLVRIQELGVRS